MRCPGRVRDPVRGRAGQHVRRGSRLAPVARDDLRGRGDRGHLRLAADRHDREHRRLPGRRRSGRRDGTGRCVLAPRVGARDPRHRAERGPWLARRAPHGDRRGAPRALGRRAAARSQRPPRLARGRDRADRRIPDRQRARGARSVIVAAGPLVLAAAACVSFAFRKRLTLVGPFSLLAIAIAFVLVGLTAPDSTGSLLDLELRLGALGRLAALVMLATLFVLVLYVVAEEPAYNFFPTALAVGATALGVVTLTAALAICGVLVLGLLVPVGSFTFQVQRNRSVEAATRHFAFVALGGCMGIAALALAASLPKDQPATTFVLLAVILVIAFALLLAAIPFHTHAALLAGEVPTAALGLYFGVLVPATFGAVAERPSAAHAPLAALAFVIGGFGMIGAPPLVGFPGRFFIELIAYQFSPTTGTVLVLATLLLLVGQLRAVILLFGTTPTTWKAEPRPVAGVIGAVIFAALLAGGLQPDGFLQPIASFADEFLKAMRPL